MTARKRRKKLPATPSVKTCPTCQRAYVTDGLQLSPIRRRILNVIERHGEVMPEILHSAIWGSDPNGGPDMKTLHMHVHYLNKVLEPYGLAIRAGTGTRGPYRLIAEAAE